MLLHQTTSESWEQAQKDYRQWVAVIVGQVYENIDRSFSLQNCRVTLLSQSSYPLYTSTVNYLYKARIGSTYLGRWNYKSTLAKLTSYLSTLFGSSAHQPRFALRQILFSYIGSFFGIAALAYLSVQTKYPLIAAPFGAAAVLVFAVP